MATRTTANVPARRARRAPTKRKQKSSNLASSPQRIKEKVRLRTLGFGGATAFAFGFLQSKINLWSIPNVPDSLTYGTAGIALGLVMKSDTVVQAATGPFFAGLHNIALHGFSDVVGGEFDNSETVAGEFDNPETVAGEFDTVTAGDFADL